MKTVLGVVLSLLGAVIILALLPFLAHAVMNALFVLVLQQPVPAWWWSLIAPIQNIVALPILAFAFVIKMGSTLSLVLPIVAELIIAGIGAALPWVGLRIVSKQRALRAERQLQHVRPRTS